MLIQAKVDEIRALLAAGELSHRKIAAATGISRASVSAIASGKRRDHIPTPPTEPETLGPLARCPECGGRVFMPCRLCRVRKLMEEERLAALARRRRARREALIAQLRAQQWSRSA